MFALSKILGPLSDPANAALVALVLATCLLWTRRWRLGRAVIALVTLVLAVVSVLPFDAWLIGPLENRFPPPPPPERVDGVIALGGMIDPVVSAARGQPSLNGAAERLTALIDLGRRYPEARLVFSGGSGLLLNQDVKEATAAAALLESLGVDPARVEIEARSRNTRENALFTRDLVAPKPGETWLLVTSAQHMPRSVGAFRAAGWTVVPWPVDYSTTGGGARFRFDLGGGLSALGSALHEWQGLAYYRLRGWTDSLFPAPERL